MGEGDRLNDGKAEARPALAPRPPGVRPSKALKGRVAGLPRRARATPPLSVLLAWTDRLPARPLLPAMSTRIPVRIRVDPIACDGRGLCADAP